MQNMASLSEFLIVESQKLRVAMTILPTMQIMGLEKVLLTISISVEMLGTTSEPT